MMRALVSSVAVSFFVVACTVENSEGSGRSGSSVDVPGVGETGSTSRSCAPGATCVCDGTGSCAYACSGRGCTLVCEGTGSCNLSCPEGGCTLDCRGAGSCSISACNGDGCTCSQSGAGTCDVN
jgi:hypothetical protein